MLRKKIFNKKFLFASLVIVLIPILNACSASAEIISPEPPIISDAATSVSTQTVAPEPTQPETSEKFGNDSPADSNPDKYDLTSFVELNQTTPNQISDETDGLESAGDSSQQRGQEPPAELLDPPPLKTALVASDPITFKLASGSPQLVEFFAFW